MSNYVGHPPSAEAAQDPARRIDFGGDYVACATSRVFPVMRWNGHQLPGNL